MKRPELLAPAVSLETLKTAVAFGADAVYIGGEVYDLWAEEKDFSTKEIKQGIAYAHEHGVKVYVTANIVAHNKDLLDAEKYLKELKAQEPDAVIVADPGMFMLVKEIYPEVDIHISTKANNTNYLTCGFWYEQGAKRITCGRGLSLREIKEIRKKAPKDMELGSFVHGRMCISSSGRQLFGNYFQGRVNEKDASFHSGKWDYAISEEKRQGEYLPVYENERGTFIFHSKDLCMIEHIPEMVDAGVDSLIIEGRMDVGYCAAVVEAYRMAVDDYLNSEEKYRFGIKEYLAKISEHTHRNFTTGFYFHQHT